MVPLAGSVVNSVMFISSCTELGDVGSIVRGVSWSGKLYQETVTLSICTALRRFHALVLKMQKNDSRILGVKIPSEMEVAPRYNC